MAQPKSGKGDKRPAGRPEEPLAIEGDWEEAVKKALKKPRPPKPGTMTGKKKPPQRERHS